MKQHEPLSWRAHEYEHYERSENWYVALGIVAIGSAVAAFILGDALFGLLILIAGFTMALFAAKAPAQHSFTITKKGVAVGQKIYTWTTLESFWLLDETEPAKLLLKSSKFLMPLIVIPLEEGLDPDEVHARLIQYLKEEEMAEPIAERIMEIVGW